MSPVFCGLLAVLLVPTSVFAHPITAAGQPAVLSLREAGVRSLRLTLKPASFAPDLPVSPVLPDRDYPAPGLTLREIAAPVTARLGELQVEVRPDRPRSSHYL